MKSKVFILTLMMLIPSSSSMYVFASPEEIPLQVGYVDPTSNQDDYQRAPIMIPRIEMDGYNITFYTPCDGCILRLLNEDGEVAYTTVINSTSLVLPSHLSGNYRIEIIRGNFCFWGYIYL